ncbi:eukaryotic translation initiation factor 3 subunit I-like [Paramacrobiotus metropolitanus]|uniref:eukaryotic translation initiation factor 3 subunit I-like n=1 Tax=Paramacrobiotus metropolitanus TaxID=2943436 RepID=UPI002445B3FF|nr:eukaryotic translation initiation factor 3 subunit I-like [Paramacrobiotus metropolitanus]
MKPILLHGHDRAITQVKYNREGDLFFSCSKDKYPVVWFSANGERLGTFGSEQQSINDRHNGAVWTIDVDWESHKVITGSGDASWRLWDCETGRTVSWQKTPTTVRCAAFSYSGNEFYYTTEMQAGHHCFLVVKDVRDPAQMQDDKSIFELDVMGNKITAATWGPFDETIIAGHSNGDLSIVEVRAKQFGKTHSGAHAGLIMDIQKSKDEIMLVTASKDTTAKLFDSMTLDCMKTYKADRPVNSAAVSPIKQHILLGGGQEAMSVTTTDVRHGKFEARFFHMVFEEEFARVRGHFGPINSVAFHPDGNSFATGGEDGYCRLHTLDPEYFEYELQY